MAALSANAMRVLRPADFVLEHKAALELSATQQSALQALSVALRDSMSARQTRALAKMMGNPPSPALAALASWTSDIDEKTLREALLKQYETALESTLGMFRDRRAVAALLTPAQAARLPQLEMEQTMRAVKRP